MQQVKRPIVVEPVKRRHAFEVLLPAQLPFIPAPLHRRKTCTFENCVVSFSKQKTHECAEIKKLCDSALNIGDCTF